MAAGRSGELGFPRPADNLQVAPAFARKLLSTPRLSHFESISRANFHFSSFSVSPFVAELRARAFALWVARSCFASAIDVSALATLRWNLLMTTMTFPLVREIFFQSLSVVDVVGGTGSCCSFALANSAAGTGCFFLDSRLSAVRSKRVRRNFAVDIAADSLVETNAVDNCFVHWPVADSFGSLGGNIADYCSL